MIFFNNVHDTLIGVRLNEHRMHEKLNFSILHLNLFDWLISCNFFAFEPQTSDLDFGGP